MTRILAVSEVDNHPRTFPTVSVKTPANQSTANTHTARIFGGSIRPADYTTVSRWRERNINVYNIEFTRSELYEVRDPKVVPSTTVSVTAPHGECIYMPELRTLSHMNMMPARLHRVSVRPNTSTKFKKIWMGIQPDRSGGETTSVSGLAYYNLFDSVIDIDNAVFYVADKITADPADYTWFGKRDVPTGSTIYSSDLRSSDWSGSYVYSIPFKTSGGINFAQWRNRFYTDLDTWNSTLQNYSSARYNMPGRYRVLMRYQVAAGEINMANSDAYIGVEVHGSFADTQPGATDPTTGFNFLESAGRKYIRCADAYETLHWIDLGELTVGGPNFIWELAHHTNIRNYSLAMTAALLNATEQEKGNTSVAVGLRLLIDRFVLVPADNFFYAQMPVVVNGNRSTYNRRLDILTGDQMNVVAHVTRFGTNNNQPRFMDEGETQMITVANVTEIDTNNWQLPQSSPSSAFAWLVIVAEDDGENDSSGGLDVELYATLRTKEYTNV